MRAAVRPTRPTLANVVIHSNYTKYPNEGAP